MIVFLLIVHGLLAVTLLGALTHQAFSVAKGVPTTPPGGIVDRFGRVSGASYTNAIILLYVVTSILGGLLYPQYRIEVRQALEDMQLKAPNMFFEDKEHFIAIGLGLLPAYWVFWRAPLASAYASSRKYITWLLAFLVWWGFLVGHVLNNIKGLR